MVRTTKVLKVPVGTKYIKLVGTKGTYVDVEFRKKKPVK